MNSLLLFYAVKTVYKCTHSSVLKELDYSLLIRQVTVNNSELNTNYLMYLFPLFKKRRSTHGNENYSPPSASPELGEEYRSWVHPLILNKTIRQRDADDFMLINEDILFLNVIIFKAHSILRFQKPQKFTHSHRRFSNSCIGENHKTRN